MRGPPQGLRRERRVLLQEWEERHEERTQLVLQQHPRSGQYQEERAAVRRAHSASLSRETATRDDAMQRVKTEEAAGIADIDVQSAVPAAHLRETLSVAEGRLSALPEQEFAAILQLGEQARALEQALQDAVARLTQIRANSDA